MNASSAGCARSIFTVSVAELMGQGLTAVMMAETRKSAILGSRPHWAMNFRDAPFRSMVMPTKPAAASIAPVVVGDAEQPRSESVVDLDHAPAATFGNRRTDDDAALRQLHI